MANIGRNSPFFSFQKSEILIENVNFANIIAKSSILFDFRNSLEKEINLSTIYFDECDVQLFFYISRSASIDINDVQCANSNYGIFIDMNNVNNSNLRQISLNNASLVLRFNNPLIGASLVNYYF